MNTPLAAARRLAVATTTTALTLAASGISPAAHALGLGNIEVLSGLNQPLRAVVPLLLEDGEAAQQLDLAIARDDEASKFGALPNLLGQNVEVVLSLQGSRMEALITTKYPVKEPHLDVVLHAKLGETKHLRIYPVLLDLPLSFFEPEEQDNSYLSDLKYRSAWNGEPSDQQASQMNEPAEVDTLEIEGENTKPFAVGSVPPPSSNDDAFEETVTFVAAREDDVALEREIADNEISAIELREDGQNTNEPRETAVADASFESRAADAFAAAFSGPKTNVEIEIEDNEVFAVQLTPEAETVGLAMDDAVSSSVIPDTVWETADGDDATQLSELDNTAVYATQLTPEAQSIGLPLELDDTSETTLPEASTAAAETQLPAETTTAAAADSAPESTPESTPDVETSADSTDIENMDFRIKSSVTSAVEMDDAESVVPTPVETTDTVAATPVASTPAPTDIAIEDMDFRIKSPSEPEVVSAIENTPDVAVDATVTAKVETFAPADIAVVEVGDSLGAIPPSATLNSEPTSRFGGARVLPAVPTDDVDLSAATPQYTGDNFDSTVELASWAGTDAQLPLPEAVLLSEVPDDLGSPVKIPSLPRAEALRRLTEEDGLTD